MKKKCRNNLRYRCALFIHSIGGETIELAANTYTKLLLWSFDSCGHQPCLVLLFLAEEHCQQEQCNVLKDHLSFILMLMSSIIYSEVTLFSCRICFGRSSNLLFGYLANERGLPMNE